MFLIWSSALHSLKTLTLFQKFSFQLIYIFMVYQHFFKNWIIFPPILSESDPASSQTEKRTISKSMFHEKFFFFSTVCFWGYFQLFSFILPHFGSCVMVEQRWTINFFLRGKIALLDKLREKAYKDGFLKQVFLSNKEWNVYLFNHQRRMTEDCFHLRLLLANKISCLSFYWEITWFLKHDTVVNKGNFFGLAAACDRLKIYRLYKKPHFT